MRKLTFFAALVASTAGCVTDQNLEALRDAPGFQAGYGDGCITAGESEKSFSTKQVRDDYAFDNDQAYQYGWRQGYLDCADKVPELDNGGRILGERNQY